MQPSSTVTRFKPVLTTSESSWQSVDVAGTLFMSRNVNKYFFILFLLIKSFTTSAALKGLLQPLLI